MNDQNPGRTVAWLVPALPDRALCADTGIRGPAAADKIFSMAVTHWSLWVGTALIGVSFSLVPAVMWPLTAGSLKDANDAGIANPAGYQPMMLYFFISSTLGFAFAMMLWRPAGRRHHKALAHAGQGVGAAA